jgi:hypothetical protein
MAVGCGNNMPILWFATSDTSEVVGCRYFRGSYGWTKPPTLTPVYRLVDPQGDGSWSPTAVACHEDGDVAVYDGSLKRVRLFGGAYRARGTIAPLTAVLGCGGLTGGGVAVLTEEVGGLTVTCYTTTGAVAATWVVEDGSGAADVAELADGRVAVLCTVSSAETVRVYRITGATAILEEAWATGGSATPASRSLTVTPSGLLCVAEATRVRILAEGGADGGFDVTLAGFQTNPVWAAQSPQSGHVVVGRDSATTEYSRHGGYAIPAGRSDSTGPIGRSVGMDAEGTVFTNGISAPGSRMWAAWRCGSTLPHAEVLRDDLATIQRVTGGWTLHGTWDAGTHSYSSAVLTRYTPPGTLISTFYTQYDAPVALGGILKGWAVVPRDEAVAEIHRAAGTLDETVGGPGAGVGLFDSPVDADGFWHSGWTIPGGDAAPAADELYVADAGNQLVQRFVASGRLEPLGVGSAFDPTFGHALLVYADDDEVIHFVRAYTSRHPWSEPVTVAVGSYPDVWVEQTGEYGVAYTNPDGTPVVVYTHDLGRTWGA